AVVLDTRDRFEGDDPQRRIADSLWPCGQATAEYSPEIAKPLQRRLAGLAQVDVSPRAKRSSRGKPCVAIITRTMDRPMFLRRALDSVAGQTFHDYIHVVINDGGDNEIVKRTIIESNCDQARVRLVDAVVNRGMEAASNLAVRNCDSDYI